MDADRDGPRLHLHLQPVRLVAVATDLIGTFPWFVPPFAKPEANLAPQITAAAAAYKARVQNCPALG